MKNNILYDAALTFNGGIETRVSPQWTLALNVGFSPFETGTETTRRWRHILVMPDARYWFCKEYSHHFLSANAVYSHFNAAKLDLPLYSTKDFRYQGDFVGAGISYGYAIPIGRNNHWNIEFEAGIDLAYAWYKKYQCKHCGSYVGNENKLFLLPKLAINLAWLLPGKYFNKHRASACLPCEALDGEPWIAPDDSLLLLPSPPIPLADTLRVDSAALAINAASALLHQRRFAEALRLLQPYANDSRAHNTIACALYMAGRRREAENLLRRAAAAGDRQAQANLRAIEDNK